MAGQDKMVYPIGFDLKKGVDDAILEWDSMWAEKLEKGIQKRAINVKLALDDKKVDYTKLEDVKRRLEGLKIEPITPQTKQAINDLARELQALAKALEQVQKYSTSRGNASPDAARAAKMAQQEALTRAKIATEHEKELMYAKKKEAQEIRNQQLIDKGNGKLSQRANIYKEHSTYLSRLTQRMAAYWSVQQVGNFLTKVREVTAQFELQKVSLGAIIQDSIKAESLFNQIKTFALKSPIPILDLTRYTKQLAAYRVETDKLFDTTKRLADVAVGLGGNGIMERLILAFGETKSTNVMNAKELRQFAFMGIPMLELVADKLSELKGKAIGTAEAFEMIKKRMVHFSVVEQIFKDMTDAGGTFYNMQEKQGDTLYGMWAKLGDAASVMYDQIGNTDSVKAGMRSTINLMTELMRNWRSVVVAVSGAGGLLGLGILAKKLWTVFSAAQAKAISATNARITAENNLNTALGKGTAGEIANAEAALANANANELAAKKATSRFSVFKSAFGSMLTGLGIGVALTVVTALIYKLAEAWEKAHRVANKIKEIKAEGDTKIAQNVSNFEFLADGAVYAKSIKERQDKLEELQRTYKNIIPVENLSIESLTRLREGTQSAAEAYNTLTQSIKDYINQEQKRKALDEISNEYGTRQNDNLKSLIGWFEDNNIDATSRGRFVAAFQETAKDTSKSLEEQIVEAFDKAGIEGGRALAKSMMKQKSFFAKILDRLILTKRPLLVLPAVAMKTFGLGDSYIEEMSEAIVGLDKDTKDVEKYYEGLTGLIGKYADAMAEARKAMDEFKPSESTGKLMERNTFKYDEAMNTEQIRQWGNVIVQALKRENIEINNAWFGIDPDKEFSAADIVKLDLDDIYAALGVGHAELKKMIGVIQKEYYNIVPKDRTVGAYRDKLKQLSDSMGVNMDLTKQYLMDGEENIEKYAKRIKESIEEVTKSIQNMRDVNKLHEQGMGHAQKGFSEEEIKEQENVLKVLQALFGLIGSYTSSGNKSDPRLQTLQEIANKMAEVNKEYDELLKKEGQIKALADTQKLFASSFKQMQDTAKKYKFKLPTFEVPQTIEDVQKWYKAVADEIKRLGLKNADKVLIELGFKSDKSAIDKVQKDIEQSLKDLADRISRTKTAKEFYEKILSQTGDIKLASDLSLRIYGENGEDLNKAIREQIETLVSGTSVKLDASIFRADNSFDAEKLREFAKANKELLGDTYKELIKLSDDAEKDFAKTIEDWLKATGKAKAYSDKMLDLRRATQTEIDKINKSEANGDIAPDFAKSQREGYLRKEAEEVAKLQYEAFKDSPMYVQMFDDLDHASTTMLVNMKSRLEDLQGEWKNLDPKQLKEMQSRLNEIDKQLARRNPFKGIVDGIKAYRKLRKNGDALGNKSSKAADKALDEASKARLDAEKKYLEVLKDEKSTAEGIANAKNDLDKAMANEQASQKTVENWKKVKDTIGLSANELFQMLNWAGDIAKGIADISEAMGADQEDVQYWNDVASALGEISGGIQDIVQSAMSGNVVGIISSAITAIPKMFVGFANLFSAGRIKRANKEIKSQQELLEQLEYTYGRLEKAAEKAFGGDYINNFKQQQKNLQAQQLAYEKQLEAEKSKGKKADKEKIKEYEEKIRDVEDEIADLYGTISEKMLGTDLTSAARDFAQAWLDAYKEFGSTADAMSEKFHEMIENMVVEGALAKVMERALQPMFDMIDNMGEQDFYSETFWKNVVSKAEQGAKDADYGAQTMMKFLEKAGISMRDLGGELTGISREIAGASEESVNGLAAGINTQNYYMSHVPGIATNVAMIRELMERGTSGVMTEAKAGWTDWQQQAMDNYVAIERHTAETVAECRKIAAACEAEVSQLRRVIVPRGTKGTHGVQVYL